MTKLTWAMRQGRNLTAERMTAPKSNRREVFPLPPARVFATDFHIALCRLAATFQLQLLLSAFRGWNFTFLQHATNMSFSQLQFQLALRTFVPQVGYRWKSTEGRRNLELVFESQMYAEPP